MKRLRPNHLGISVRNLDASLAFYGALGFSEVNRTTFDEGQCTLVHMQLDEFVIELFAYRKNAGIPALEPGFGNDLHLIGLKHLALATDDIHGALEDLRERGLADESVEIGAIPSGLAQYIFIKDPDGMWVEIIQEDRFNIYREIWASAPATSDVPVTTVQTRP